MLTFSGLEQRYGEAVAYSWLLEIEKTVNIRSRDVDLEKRLARALRLQDAKRATGYSAGEYLLAA